jgi:hypothetical protein
MLQDMMPRSAVYTELVREFGPRIRNFPQSSQLFWSEFKKCLTCKDGESLLIECFHGRRVSRGGMRDRWVQLPSLEDSRAWWCRHKFENSWGQPGPVARTRLDDPREREGLYPT